MKAKAENKEEEWKDYLPKGIEKLHDKLEDISQSLSNSNPNKIKIREIKPLFVYVTFNSEADKENIMQKWK